ncbi:MAG: membrane protein insertase YidC [Bryobacteraceae bacterium]|nr:membrane protein insertase YidC [Bryobacteraceae bacterium]
MADNKQEFSMERNLLLFFVIAGSILYFSSTLFPTATPPKPPARKEIAQAPSPVPSPPAAPAVKPGMPAPAAVVGAKEEFLDVDTDVHKVRFSTRGGVVISWQLKKYKDTNGKPLELVQPNGAANPAIGYPLRFAFTDKFPGIDANQVIYAHRFPTEGFQTIEFEYADANFRGKKKFVFEKSDYRVQVSSEAYVAGQPAPHNLTWRGGFGDATVNAPSGYVHSIHMTGPDATKGEGILGSLRDPRGQLIVRDGKAASSGTMVERGQFAFAGVEDSYFAAVFFPKLAGQPIELRTYSDSVKQVSDGNSEPHAGVSVGGNPANDFTFFVGPKDVDILRATDPNLERIIDWGAWLGWLAKPLFAGLVIVHNWVKGVAPNYSYGWAIVIVTVMINMALLPLKITSLKSAKKMQAIQPEFQKINKKYEGLGMNDPRMTQKNEEVMALYKRHGVNPAGGCIPLLIQMPFLFAFLTVLNVAIQMRGAQFLWVTDLSRPETIPVRLLPLMMVGTQFLLQKMTPTSPGMDPAQAKMMMFMPLMFLFFFYSASSGLVLYWLIGNIIAIAQQWFFNRFL